MNRAQAERERGKLAAEHPDATWILAEAGDGWQVVKVGMPPGERASGTAIAAKPKPPTPDSPPSPNKAQVNLWWGGA